MEVNLHTFFILTLKGNEWASLRFSFFTAGKELLVPVG
jgi:hypothetical protein